MRASEAIQRVQGLSRRWGKSDHGILLEGVHLTLPTFLWPESMSQISNLVAREAGKCHLSVGPGKRNRVGSTEPLC